MRYLVVNRTVLKNITLYTMVAIFLFYILKQVLHNVLSIPNIGVSLADANVAALFVFISSFPALGLLFIISSLSGFVSKFEPTHSKKEITYLTNGVHYFIGFNLLATIFLFFYVFSKNGLGVFVNTYQNRLILEHGIFALITIVLTPTILASIILSGYRNSKIGIIFAWFISLIWGYIFAKAFFLAYPIFISVLVRKRLTLRRIFFLMGLMFTLASLVVYMGLLRSGNSLEELDFTSFFEFTMLLILHRVDQLDGIATLIVAKPSFSGISEVIKSIEYLIPRFLYSEKPLSFSVEMTKTFRPSVFESGGANNFSLFGQIFTIYSWTAILVSNSIILCVVFLSSSFTSSFLKSHKVRQIFILSVVLPATLSLLNSGLFREYFLLQISYGMLLIFLFKALERNVKI